MLNKKTALITGAASGIGREAAFGLSNKGVSLVLSDTDKAGLIETQDCILAQGGTVYSKEADISDEKQVIKLVQFTIEKLIWLDIAVNSAAVVGEMGPTADYKVSDWDRVLNTNLRGQWLCMKYEIPEMVKNGGGSIINVSSVLGKVGFANAPAYVAAEHGLIGLTKAAALDYAKNGVRMNVVAPGFMVTPSPENGGFLYDDEMKQQIIALHPIGRLGRPEEISDAIVWLASDESSFVTGHTLMVDGGYTAR